MHRHRNCRVHSYHARRRLGTTPPQSAGDALSSVIARPHAHMRRIAPVFAVSRGGWKMYFPKIAESERVARLEPRKGKIRVVIDTDGVNEIDDPSRPPPRESRDILSAYLR